MLGAVLAALAAAVLVGSPPSLERLGHGMGSRLSRGAVATARPGWTKAVGLVVAVLVVIGMMFGLAAAGWALVAAIAAGTAAWVATRARAERRWRARADETARATVGLALLLRVGQIPSAALMEVAADCPALAPVATAASLGADVPQAFREAAEQPGRGGLRRVAGAWRVAERTGAPVASVLQQVAEGLRAERELAGLVEAELAMARGSSRVMAALPLGAVLLGTLAGADPLGFLTRSPFGLVLALAGVTLAALGVVWTEKLAARS